MVSSDQEVQCDPMNLDQLNQSKEVLDKNIESGKKWVNNSTASPGLFIYHQLLQILLN